jgi:hypothetical protein
MKKVYCVLLILSLISQAFGSDRIITKKNKKYNGKVIKIVEKGFVVKTVEGSVIVIPKTNISLIYTGNKILDFNKKMSYYLEVRHPYLPFAILGIATGAYSVKKFGDYSKMRKQIKKENENAEIDSETNNTNDDKNALAVGIVSALFSVGSFYIALRPMEVKVPIGRLNLSASPCGMTLALHF